MRKISLFLLSVSLASGAFAACGGEVGHGAESADSGGLGGAGGSGSSGGDGSNEDADAPPDAMDAPDAGDGSDGDAPAETCIACSVNEYTCASKGMESFSLMVSAAGADGCIVTNPLQNVAMELHCAPLELCDSPPKTCYPVAMETAGVLTWTPPKYTKVSCYPKK